MNKPDRLYGLEGAEYLEIDIDGVLEKLADDGVTGEVIIEEWTVTDTRLLLPNSDWILDYVLDHLDEVTEEWHETAANASVDPEVRTAFDAALNVWASKIRYWMADEKVATHRVTVPDGS